MDGSELFHETLRFMGAPPLARTVAVSCTVESGSSTVFAGSTVTVAT
jgi:hypothetical protein